MSTSNPKKVVVFAPSWVGDMVMAQTLFQLIKQQDPNTIIDVVAPPATESLAKLMPEIRKSFRIPGRYGKITFKQRFEIARLLRQEAYDEAILLPNSFLSALLPFLARIPKRVGWHREGRFILLNDARRLDKSRLTLVIERFMALGVPKNAEIPSPYPRPRFEVDPTIVSAVRNKFQLNQTQPILTLCPGAEYGPAKRWPAEYYGAVAKERVEAGWQVWIFGSPKEKPLAEIIQATADQRCVDLTGRTDLLEAVNLLSCANQVVSNDSGLMHIASALARPVVAIYGSTLGNFAPPLAEHAKSLELDLPCRPCGQRECPLGHLNCLRLLTPQMVLSALAELEAN